MTVIQMNITPIPRMNNKAENKFFECAAIAIFLFLIGCCSYLFMAFVLMVARDGDLIDFFAYAFPVVAVFVATLVYLCIENHKSKKANQ